LIFDEIGMVLFCWHWNALTWMVEMVYFLMVLKCSSFDSNGMVKFLMVLEWFSFDGIGMV
jgi:hypothetical protein